MFYSTKKFGPITTSHRQWRDEGHCSWIHGYSRYVQLTFKAVGGLDDKTWVWDFGKNKFFSNVLEEQWDHRTLIASDDPQLPFLQQAHELGVISINVMDVTKGHSPGIEGSCKYLYDLFKDYVERESNGRVILSKVEIWEHEKNSAFYEPE